MLEYYIFSGEQCTSIFKEESTVTPLKKLQQNPSFQVAFSQLGTLYSGHSSWSPTGDCILHLYHVWPWLAEMGYAMRDAAITFDCL